MGILPGQRLRLLELVLVLTVNPDPGQGQPRFTACRGHETHWAVPFPLEALARHPTRPGVTAKHTGYHQMRAHSPEALRPAPGATGAGRPPRGRKQDMCAEQRGTHTLGHGSVGTPLPFHSGQEEQLWLDPHSKDLTACSCLKPPRDMGLT